MVASRKLTHCFPVTLSEYPFGAPPVASVTFLSELAGQKYRKRALSELVAPKVLNADSISSLLPGLSEPIWRPRRDLNLRYCVTS
jgi:hypothetical protein